MTRGQGAKRLGIFLRCVSPLLAPSVGAAMSAIAPLSGFSGIKADVEKSTQLTHVRHWLRTAAMVLMPIFAPIKAIV